MWLLLILMVVSSFSLLSDLGEAKPYNNRFSFSKALDAKMKCYPYRHKMGWLKGYMNFFLPVYLIILVLSSTDNIYDSQSGSDGAMILQIILQGIQIVMILINIICLRDINKFSYWFNVATCIVLAACFILPSIIMIVGWMISGLNTNNGILGAIDTISAFALIVDVLLMLALWGGTIAYFHVRKELFMKTEEELHREYGSIED